jgi:hypothetical protein
LSESHQGREPSATRKLASVLVCLVATIAAGVLTALFVHFSADTPSANFAVPSPQMVLLTDQSNASVTYSIAYYQGSVTSPGETQFGPADSVAPLGTRRMTFRIHVAPGTHQLRFAMLLNTDASMIEPTAIQGLGFIDATIPAGEIQSPCPSILSFDTTQVLSGVTDVDSTGEATIDVVGGVPGHVRYRSNGDRTPVNVLQMLPVAGDTGASAAGTCAVNLVNWEQVGGIGWQTPTFGSGQVTIGSVPAGQYIESSNPAVVDAQTLAWNLTGPADVSYTLFDSNSQSSHELWLFLAGITAALGATLLVEIVKGSPELVWLLSHRGDDTGAGQPARPHVSPSPGPNVNGQERAPQWPVFLAGVLSGVLVSRLRHHRDE